LIYPQIMWQLQSDWILAEHVKTCQEPLGLNLHWVGLVDCTRSLITRVDSSNFMLPIALNMNGN